MEIVSNSAADTIKIGKFIAKNLKQGDIICLFGGFGSGKTVLVKGIARGLGIRGDKIISPSFVLLRQHLKAKIPLYHFDLYRLKTARDIAAIGYEEYFYNEGISVIEWAEKLGFLLPKEYLKIELFIKAPAKRLFKFGAFGRHYKELLGKIRGAK